MTDSTCATCSIIRHAYHIVEQDDLIRLQYELVWTALFEFEPCRLGHLLGVDKLGRHLVFDAPGLHGTNLSGWARNKLCRCPRRVSA